MATEELQMSILNLKALNDETKSAIVKDETGVIIADEHKTEDSTSATVENGNQPAEDVPMVVMDGPLGKVYTQALNLAFAKEAASASGQTDIKVVFDEDIERDDEGNDKALYVYCCDASNMSTSDAVEGTDKLRVALDSKKYAKVYAIMESHHAVKPAAGLFEEYAVNNGVKVIFKKDIAIEAIQDAVKL